MPKRTDVHKIMIIGSGPIVIGQAAEFDYSGTQALKALRALGYEVVLVNSNPATIMTDTDLSDRTYIEPLNLNRLSQIIEKERPDALLPNLGGQSGLNLTLELWEAGILQKYDVEVLGVQVESIVKGEDRVAFKETMSAIGVAMARSKACYTIDECLSYADAIGYPVVVRPAYTMGGQGGGLCWNRDELAQTALKGLEASLINQVLIEESILGWEELELEIIRDAKGQLITICYIENVDPLGVHTGDSICTAPMLTIDPSVQRELEAIAHAIVEKVGVIGGTNVQFARNPEDGRIVVIEINPRTSRSSALASKATGFPIALVSGMLSLGLTLDEIPSDTYGTLKDYVPRCDYIALKFPRWTFEKFSEQNDHLGTQMQAVGEVMSIGKTYKEALQKAVRSLEIGRSGLGEVPELMDLTTDQLLERLSRPTSERHFILYEALKKGAPVDLLVELTGIKPYFINALRELVDEETEWLAFEPSALPKPVLLHAKQSGFSDAYMAKTLKVSEALIREQRERHAIHPAYHKIDVAIGSGNQYYYSTYNALSSLPVTSQREKIAILGGGPNRIGQGIEFDYCCVQAALALREQGYETIMINCNPETVSTDYDISDNLYFEPLTLEDVLSIYKREGAIAAITQFGGQTPLNLATRLEEAGVKILGTSPEVIDLAEDRDYFRNLMAKLAIPMPESGMASTPEEALTIAESIGYPVMARPSFVLGGRGMAIVHTKSELIAFMNEFAHTGNGQAILIDRFLQNALECEVDALSNGCDTQVLGVMEHIELAGIHSGDSAAVFPSVNIPAKQVAKLIDYTKRIAESMNVVGMLNLQFAIEGDVVYVIEANPRASRTVPIVSKIADHKLVHQAIAVMIADFTQSKGPDHFPIENLHFSYYGVKEAVFPFNRFGEQDPVLGPEMRSTGEVLGLGRNLGESYYKAQEAIQRSLPESGLILLSVDSPHKEAILPIARGFQALGFTLAATEGTKRRLAEGGVETILYSKVSHRAGENGKYALEDCAFVSVTPTIGGGNTFGSLLRKRAVETGIPYATTIAGAATSLEAIVANRNQKGLTVTPLQDYLSQ